MFMEVVESTRGQMMRVLVIEDEKEIREFICDELKFAGMDVLGLENGLGVLTAIETFSPNIVLTDQMMPGKSGVEVIKEIRASGKFATLPVMMITALGGEMDKVKAFEMGADDYVTKPFMGKEVVARIRALVRRTTQTTSQQKLIKYKNLEVDFSAHRVLMDGQELFLTLTEFKILGELVKQAGMVLSRDALRERALGNMHVTDRTIDVHMASLRKKLNSLGDDIETVRGVGYRLAN